MRPSLHGSTQGQMAKRRIQSALLATVFVGACSLAWAGKVAEMQLSPLQRAFNVPLVLDLSRMPQSVSVELDGYDVSAFATALPDGVQMNLELPLASGKHQLVVLANYADGSIETLLAQPLSVVTDSPLAPENWSANVSLDSSYLAIKKDESAFTGISNTSSNGGAVIRGAHATGDWQLDVAIDSLYDSNVLNSESQEEIDLANYQLAASRQTALGNSRLQVGDSLVGGEGLVFSGYRRRGVAFNHESSERLLQAEAFALQTEPTTSVRENVLYPFAADERAFGTAIVLRPLEGDQQAHLQLRTSYLSGASTATGNGFYTPDTAEYAGDVSSVGVLSEWLQSSLAFEAEYASSDFDFDGVDQGAGAQDDQATRYMARLASGAQLASGPLDQWMLQLSNTAVGRYFYSLGNRTLPGDLDTDRVEFVGSVKGFSFSADAAQASNNLDNDAAVADFEHDTAGMLLYYTPTGLAVDRGVWRWLGRPSLEAGYRSTEQVQDRNDASLVGYDINNQTDELMGGVSFAFPGWRWYLQQARIDFDERAKPVFADGFQIFTPASDSRNDQTTLQLSFSPSAWIYIAPMAQYNRVTESATGRSYTASRFGIDTQYHLLRNKLIMTLNYSEDRSRQIYNDPLYQNGDSVYRSGMAQLLWKLVPAKGIQPGVDLYTKGSIGRYDDLAGNIGDETWQLLLGATVYWAD